MKAFGQNLKEAREKYQYTQAKLASLLQTSQQYVSRLEHGKTVPSLQFVRRIMKVLNVSFEFLKDGMADPD